MSTVAGASAVETPTASRGARHWILRVLQVVCALAVLVVLVGAVTTDGFFTVANGKAIVSSISFVGIIAVGMTVIMISGSFVSMSLGTTAAVTAMIFVTSLRYGVGVAIALTLVVGFVIGAIQGGLIGGWGANPIILTIAAGAIQQGLSVAISQGETISPTGGGYVFLNDTPLGLPVGLFVLLALVFLTELVMRRTRFGRQVYLVGDNTKAARAAGLPMGRIGVGVFGLAGLAAAIAGVLLGAYNQGASLLLDGTLTYDAIAATLVGGASVAGGRGAVWRTLLGAVAIATITDLLLLRGYSTGMQILVKGLLVVVVVLAVHLRSGERSS